MAKTNIYDRILAELVYRTDSLIAATGAPYIQITNDLPYETSAPFNFNGTITATSEVKNIPTGYTVKANTHILTYTGTGTTNTSSSSLQTGSAIAVIFTMIGNTYVITSNVTLEKAANPDIVVTTSTLTVTGTASIFAGTKAVNNSFVTTTLTSYVYSTSSPIVNMGTQAYPYIVIPTALAQPIYILDENNLIIPMSDFTVTAAAGYNYYVLNWAVPFWSLSTNWTIIF